jgi:predicted Zn finger-like uncharacterized protein
VLSGLYNATLMSLITKCPACATMFKVVPDQLRVSEGWVRCGQCNEVFDANLNLQADIAGFASGPHQEPAVEPDVPQTAGTSDVRVQQDLEAIQSTHAVPHESDAPADDPFLTVNPHALHLEPQDHLLHPVEPPLDVVVPDGLGEQHSEAVIQDSHDTAVVGDDAVEHSFLKSQTGNPLWARRSVRVLLAVFCLLLSMLIAWQVVIHERDRIAAHFPESKSLLEAACIVAGCKVAPFRQIEAVVIDSSSFTKVRSDVYRLNFTLKNAVPINIAAPAMELTVTDMNDQPVIRRIFLATEFGEKSGVMAPGAELSVTLPISVKLVGNVERISGYRLLSFYP